MPLIVGAGHPPDMLGQNVGLQRDPARHSQEKHKGGKTSAYTLWEWELMERPGTRPDADKITIK